MLKEKHIHRWFLGFILMLHLGIKLFTAADMSIWGDEAFSIFYSQRPFADLNIGLAEDLNPRLFYYLLHFWIKMFGIGVFSVKALSILFSVGTAFFLYKIGRMIQGTESAVLVSFMFLFSNLHFDFSHEVRAYCLICLETSISFYLFLKYLKHRDLKVLIGLTLVNAAIAYTHYVALLVPVIQFVAIWFFNPKKTDVKWIITSYIASAILFTPFLFQMLSVTPGEEFWLSKPNWNELQYVFYKLVGNDNYFWYLFIPFTLSPLLMIGSIKKKVFQEPFDSKIYILLYVWFFLTVFINYLVAQWIPVFRLRYVLHSSLAIYLGLSYLIWHLQLNKRFLYALSTLVVLIFLIEFSPTNRGVEKWEETAEYLNANKDDKVLTIVCAKYKLKDLYYYLDREKFKDYKYLKQHAFDRQIFAMNDTSYLKDVNDLESYIGINLVLSHDIVVDPENSLSTYIESHGYVLCDEIGQSGSAKILFYRKAEYPCEQLTLTDTNDEKLDCFHWIKKTYINELSAGQVIEYSINKIQEGTCKEYGQFVKNSTDVLEYGINREFPFSPTFIIKNNEYRKIKFKANLSGPVSNNAKFIVSVDFEDDSYLYESYSLTKLIDNDSMHIVEFTSIPSSRLPEDSYIKVYVWNPEKEFIVMQDFKILLYK